MKRSFISTPKFLQLWKQAGLNDDDDIRSLEKALLEHPDKGDVIKGTGGLRKLRIAAGSKGKRGGGRVIYKDFAEFGQIFFLYFLRKNESDDLSSDQRKVLAQVVKELESSLSQRKKDEKKDKEK